MPRLPCSSHPRHRAATSLTPGQVEADEQLITAIAAYRLGQQPHDGRAVAHYRDRFEALAVALAGLSLIATAVGVTLILIGRAAIGVTALGASVSWAAIAVIIIRLLRPE